MCDIHTVFKLKGVNPYPNLHHMQLAFCLKMKTCITCEQPEHECCAAILPFSSGLFCTQPTLPLFASSPRPTPSFNCSHSILRSLHLIPHQSAVWLWTALVMLNFSTLPLDPNYPISRPLCPKLLPPSIMHPTHTLPVWTCLSPLPTHSKTLISIRCLHSVSQTTDYSLYSLSLSSCLLSPLAFPVSSPCSFQADPIICHLLHL